MKNSRTHNPAASAEKRTRRSKLLQRLDVNPEELQSSAKVYPLLKRCDISPARVIEVLRADHQVEASRAVVAKWDDLSPSDRALLAPEVLEALAISSGLPPRSVWELYCRASMVQSREAVGVLIAESLPAIMRVTARQAKMPKGLASREHIYKAARVLPTPRGSVINIGVPQQQELSEGDDDGDFEDLESADDFLLRASKAMRVLPAPEKEPGIINADVDDDDDEDGG
jgi:hypothetical protein